MPMWACRSAPLLALHAPPASSGPIISLPLHTPSHAGLVCVCARGEEEDWVFVAPLPRPRCTRQSSTLVLLFSFPCASVMVLWLAIIG